MRVVILSGAPCASAPLDQTAALLDRPDVAKRVPGAGNGLNSGATS